MNLSILSTFPHGGAGIAARRLHEALGLRDGIHSDLYYFQQPGKKNYLHLAKLALEKLPLRSRIADRDNLFRFSTATQGFDISNAAFIKDADLIHLHWINNGFLSIRSLQKLVATGKPVFWTMHDMWAFTGGCHHSRECMNFTQHCGDCFYLKNPSPNDLSHRVWERKKTLFENANITFIACSNWLGDRARMSSLALNKRIEVIPNPINTDIFKPGDKRAAKISFGIDPEKKIISFAAANISDIRKGFSFLHGALNHLTPEEQANTELLILGHMKNHLELDLPLKVHLTGYLSDERKIVAAYNASDVFVLPSLEENLPNTIMEAMTCGVPSVAFRVGGIPDLITHGKTGYLAEYMNEADLAAGIQKMLNADGEIRSFCREKSLAEYSYAVVGQRMADLYADILKLH